MDIRELLISYNHETLLQTHVVLSTYGNKPAFARYKMSVSMGINFIVTVMTPPPPTHYPLSYLTLTAYEKKCTPIGTRIVISLNLEMFGSGYGVGSRDSPISSGITSHASL
jgi:hypothetical protein